MVPVNYLAVLACGVAAMVIGYVWYGPLFGKLWMSQMGLSPDDAMGGSKNMGMLYGIQAVGSLVMAYVLAHALIFASAYLHISGINAGLQSGFWSWLGFVAPVTVGAVLWENKPWGFWLLNNAYYLIVLCVMGVILALWM